MFIPFPIYVIGRENFVTVHFVPGNLAKLYFRSSGGIIICGQLCFSVYRDSNTGSSAELMQIVYYEQLADAKPFFIRLILLIYQRNLFIIKKTVEEAVSYTHLDMEEKLPQMKAIVKKYK